MEEAQLFHFGEAKVYTPRGDYVKVPFFKNNTRGDEAWVVPALVFWQVVIQEGVVPQGDFEASASQGPYRAAGLDEVRHLQDKPYLSSSIFEEYMVPIGELAQCLEDLNGRFGKLDASIKCLLDIEAHSKDGVVAHNTVQGDFAQIDPCLVPQEQLEEYFSLLATHPEYYEEGTQFRAQLDACKEFCFNPPVGCGIRKPMTPAMLQTALTKAGAFFGYALNIEGLEPSFGLLRETHILARFFSFRGGRGNSENTKLISISGLKALLPFALWTGACPGVPSIPQIEIDKVIAWYKEVEGRFRASSKVPENKRSKPTTLTLWEVWEHIRSNWELTTTHLQVTCHEPSS